MKALTAQGANVKPLEEIAEKPMNTRKKSLRGILSDYADAALTAQEAGAWERAAANKYGGVNP